MADEREVDVQLVAVLNEALDAVYQAKQAAWSATKSPAREDQRELVSFLIDQSGRFMVAEERIGGRSPDVSSPSSHRRGNLVAEVGGDHHRTAISLPAQRLAAVAADLRARAVQIPTTPRHRCLPTWTPASRASSPDDGRGRLAGCGVPSDRRDWSHLGGGPCRDRFRTLAVDPGR